jgi:hypothetical protein
MLGVRAVSARPRTEGHYWAKQIASDDVRNEPSDTWEVVQTFENRAGKFELRVFIPGVERSQPISNFQWGPRVIRPTGCDS